MCVANNWSDTISQYKELVEFIRLHPKTDKTRIAERIGISTTTLYKCLDDLKKNEIINDNMTVNTSLGTFVGISIGTSLCKVVFLNFDFTPYCSNDFALYKKEIYYEINNIDPQKENGKENDSRNYIYFETPGSFVKLKKYLNCILNIIQNHIENGDLKVLSIGLSSTGAIDQYQNMICQSHNLAYLDGRTVSDMLFDDKEQYFQRKKIEIFFVQNSLAATIAERFKLNEENLPSELYGKKNIVTIYLEFGIGAGFVFNNRLYNGNGFAGELGHSPVPLTMYQFLANIFELDTLPPCTCGSYYCIDNIIRSVAFADVSSKFIHMSSDEIRSFLSENPERAECLGMILGNISNLLSTVFNVDLVIFTGKLYKSNDVLRKYIKATMDENNLKFNRRDCITYTSHIGTLAPAIGAAIYSYYRKCNIELKWM